MARKTVAATASSSNDGEGTTTVKEEIPNAVPLDHLSLDGALDEVSDEMKPLSVEQEYQVEKHKLRLKYWRESPFAIGLTEATWIAERFRPDVNSRAHGDSELERDSSGCLCFSAQICPLLRAGRVGNMVILKSSHEWVEEVTEDEETGEQTSRRYTRPVLDIVVGPYWPMLVFVTYPIIFGVSGWTLVYGIAPGGKPPLLIFMWTVCTVGLIVALALTACCDPGIMYKYKNPPPQSESTWRWTDQAETYRPRGAYYDADTAVVVEEFDHT
jgi:hypothetical protein